MTRFLIFNLFILSFLTVNGQVYKSTSSEITFFSEAPLEDIAAVNKEGKGLIDIGNKKFAFIVPIDGFDFEKSLMQEHFNEKYMDSDKYPRATFSGNIENWDPNLSEQIILAVGELTIHGVTHEVEIESQLSTENEKLFTMSEFSVKLEDYDIDRPQLLWENIAEVIDVKVKFEFQEK